MADQIITFSPAEKVTAILPNLERIIRGLLYVYIFSLPFHRLLFIERNGFIILLALLTLWCMVNKRHFFTRTPIDLPLIALLGWVGISVPFATFPEYSFQEFAKLLQQGLIFYVAVYFLREARERNRAFWLLIGGLGIISLYGLWQFEAKPWSGPNSADGRPYYLIQSFLSSEVWLTTYLVTLIPLGVACAAVTATVRWQQVLVVLITGLAVLCQAFTFSRAGLLALLTEAIVWAVMVRTKIVILFVVGLFSFVGTAAALLVVMDRDRSLVFIPGHSKLTSYNLESRVQAWQLGLVQLSGHPILGIGYGKHTFFEVTKNDSKRLASLIPGDRVPMATGLHNSLLEFGVGAGLPAGIAYLWLMWTIGKAGWSQFRAGPNYVQQVYGLTLIVMVTGVFIRNCFDHMWIGTMALLFWVCVALLLVSGADSESRRQGDTCTSH